VFFCGSKQLSCDCDALVRKIKVKCLQKVKNFGGAKSKEENA
jgi:hypothetical protein